MILVCVAELNPYKLFWPHFCEWYALNKDRHNLILDHYCREALHIAQGNARDKARENSATHILFVEDDHWGFPIDALDALLDEEKEIVALYTIGRRPPHVSLAMDRNDPFRSMIDGARNLSPKEHIPGDPLVQQRDLVSLGFTLVQTDLFKRLKNDPFAVWGQTSTDTYLCQYAADIGVRPWVHYGACLPHGDVTLETRFLSAQMSLINQGKRTSYSAKSLSGSTLQKPEQKLELDGWINLTPWIEGTLKI